VHEGEGISVKNQCKEASGPIDKAHCLMARDYKGFGNQPMTGVFEWLKEYIVPFDQTLQILDKEVENGKIGYFRSDSQANRVYYIHNKAVTLCGEAGGGAAKMGQYLFGCITPDRVNKRQNGQRFNDGNKFYTLTAQDKHGVLIEGYIRKLTPIECERLQTMPDNYTDGISNSQRYKCLGNGWTVDVIAHILSGIKNTAPDATNIESGKVKRIHTDYR
jgi:site-specific DNA-cytosine methylase